MKLLGERDAGELTTLLHRYLHDTEVAEVIRRFCEDVALDVVERLVYHAEQRIEVDGLIIKVGAVTADAVHREIDVRGLHDEVEIFRSARDST